MRQDGVLGSLWQQHIDEQPIPMDPIPLTAWLRAAASGDGGDRAYARVYAELRRFAARQWAGPAIRPR
ncbi:hypothetical protein GCM10009105_20280 [Dokdonella soli]|uniref:Uncharacterized protein n=1 Tax=Dokdonella soli TaxID=529810 RepID=A0ABN1IJE7_9GAMM